MSTLVLLVVPLLLLLGAVGLMFFGILAYAVYRWPVLSQPVTVFLTGVAGFFALISLIVAVGGALRAP
ncbi:hypothetical protein ACFU93_21280 [Streptomyces sp. NPDC057611]|uniref:hypothetical protein n=1 Tax=Streptomyces sp. NPDC057611 TaxID=3346182 RepID=UPI00367ABB14